MSVQTGADLPLDVFGGLLTEVGPSNMPAGGSPANLNVEFLPGLVRTRGGAQVENSYTAIPGGPWQVRYTKSYGQVPEVQSQISLLVNPTHNTSGAMASTTSNQIGSVYGYGSQLPWAPYAQNPGWAGPLAFSSTQFGREYIGISEGRYGYDIPRQWDGTNYDRVSQCGPGQAPTVTDSTATIAIEASAAGLIQFKPSITLIYQIDNTVYVYFNNTNQALYNAAAFLGAADIAISGTGISAYNGTFGIASYLVSPAGVLQGFTYLIPTTGGGTATTGTVATPLTQVNLATAPPYPPIVGQNLTIQSAGVTTYDGTWAITATPTPANGMPANQLYVVVGQTNLAASGGGTVLTPGNIVAGLHQVSVVFITRQGYKTRPAPPSSWISGGGVPAVASGIPTGPANVVARLLIFTPYLTPPAITGTFYSIQQTTSLTSTVMLIPDNTTTSLTVNFSDSDLLAGFNAQYLFTLRELGECAGCFPYAGRMFYWGELNTMQDFLNIEFNGGWNGNTPLGWVNGVFTDGTKVANGGVWGDAYNIANSGTGSDVTGLIFQSAYQNWLGTPLLTGATQYGVRLTAKATTPSTVVVAILPNGSGAGLGSPLATAIFTVTPINGVATYYTQIMDFSALMPAVIPAGALLAVYMPNGPNAQNVTIDRVNPFPSKQPITYTGAWVSYVNDPESIDGVTGLFQPIYTNGQAIRTMYVLRDSLYIVCDRSTFVTKDVPGSEPASWTDDPVSATVGCTGPNAATSGEDWEVKVNRYGLYIYLGHEPQKISQEIQSLWNKPGGPSTQINWAYGYKIWTSVDLLNKRVYIGAPTGTNTECDTMYVMDYNTLDTSAMIAEYPTLRFSAYTGRRVILEQGRKWTQWKFQYLPVSTFVPTPLETHDLHPPVVGQMPIPCGAFVEMSDGTAEFVFGGGNTSSTYAIDTTQRGNDNGFGFVSSYTSHFFPTQDEEQTAQPESGPMRAHMHLFSFLRQFVRGSGTLLIRRFSNTLDPNPPQNPPKSLVVQLKLNPVFDVESDFDADVSERWALQWSTSGEAVGEWWQMERTTRVVEQSPNEMVRGSNIQ